MLRVARCDAPRRRARDVDPRQEGNEADEMIINIVTSTIAHTGGGRAAVIAGSIEPVIVNGTQYHRTAFSPQDGIWRKRLPCSLVTYYHSFQISMAVIAVFE